MNIMVRPESKKESEENQRHKQGRGEKKKLSREEKKIITFFTPHDGLKIVYSLSFELPNNQAHKHIPAESFSI